MIKYFKQGHLRPLSESSTQRLLKCQNVLSFHPNHNVKAIVKNLIEHMDEFKDWDDRRYYNIDTLKLLSANNALRSLDEVVR